MPHKRKAEAVEAPCEPQCEAPIEAPFSLLAASAAGGAAFELSAADAGKSQYLREKISRGARFAELAFGVRVVDRVHRFLTHASAEAADADAQVPQWTSILLDLPVVELLDLCQAAALLGLQPLCKAVIEQLRHSALASSTQQDLESSRLIESANAPIFGIDRQGLVNVWNQCACSLTGFATEEVMGKRLVDFIFADFRQVVDSVFKSALKGDETANLEFPLLTKTGARIEILLNATPRRDTNSSIIGVVGIGQDITARIAQEQEYARLIDTANAPIIGIDVNGHVNVWNLCASNLTSFKNEEVMGKHLVNVYITEDYKASVQDVFDKALRGTETANFEFPLVTKHGTRVQVLLNATTRRDEQGEVIGVEQEYARLIDSANAPIFGIDVNGHVNVWNECASTLTGFKGEEVMGKHLVNVYITNEYKASVQDVFDKAMRGDETANFEFPLITHRGLRVEILLNATTRRDEHDKVVGVVGIGQDITARIAQEREYSRLIDTANAPIFGVDVNGHVNVWNQCASNLTGFAGKEVMGNHLVSTFITVEYRTSVQDVLEKAMHGVETSNFEFPLMNKDGSRLINILLNATTRRDAFGGVVGVVGIGQDISEARAKRDAELRQREAEAAQAAQATISAHVYHEIRNVVGAVLALADRVSEAVEPKPAPAIQVGNRSVAGIAATRAVLALSCNQEDALALLTSMASGPDEIPATVRKALPQQVRKLTEHQRLVCQHAVNTLNDMLDVAKIENGMYAPKEEPVDLGELVSRSAKLQGPRLRPGVELVINAPPAGALIVTTDSVLLLQFLTNLLSNAAKFTASGAVMVFCHVIEETPDGGVAIVLGVGDTGPGIAADQQLRVLQAFTTGDAVPHEDLRDASRSTGIGLRFADLIANVLSEPLQPEAGNGARRSPAASLDAPAATAPYEPATGPARWRRSRRGVQLESPLSSDLRQRMATTGGPGTVLWLVARTRRARRAGGDLPSRAARALNAAAGRACLRPVGLLRVLVVDDQRTMRQMAATLFQRLCQDHATLRVELHTAFSGEQAVRMCARRHFHVITMDEQLSESYCRAVTKEQGERREAGARRAAPPAPRDPDEPPPPVVFDGDRITNARARLAFFEKELDFLEPRDGDGALHGHEAVREIRELEAQQRAADPLTARRCIIFNLTGNVLESDRIKYTTSGSNGVLPKPTKLTDLTGLLEQGLASFVESGICRLVGDSIVFVNDDFQVGTLTHDAACERPALDAAHF
ncbi:hypothetical protein M885DRAFT_589608 [Pelagophyceae sp. CCMP2097]|nr:hypothetical protein M885DRAFT_589608 [Pelagophyceae sp. CCMP2097]